MKKKFSMMKRCISILLALVLVLAGLPATGVFATEGDDTIEFQRGENNKPIFDGMAEHLDAFVDLILSEMSLEDLAFYAYTKGSGSRTVSAGYTLPASYAGGHDRVQGVSTDFPSGLALSNSWNKELVNEVGTVMGNERRGEFNDTTVTNVMFSTVADMRTNPLSGRFDEGLGEDAMLAADLLDSMAKGIQGYGEEGNEDGLWLKAPLGTKHYTNYLAQWFRIPGQFYASARGMNEYQMKSFMNLFENGSVSAMMTTYGRTNGIPNHTSPNVVKAITTSPYGIYSVGDFMNGDARMTAGFNNGYQTYTDAVGLAALLLLSGNHMNTSSNNQANTLAAVNQGIYGLTRADLEDSVRPIVVIWVRSGYFNQTVLGDTESGNAYPYTDISSNRDKRTYADEDSQEIALQASRESVVLLKNNGVLPLEKDSDIAMTGFLGKARFKAVYATSTPSLDGTRLNPLDAITEANGSGSVIFNEGNKLVAYEAVDTGEVMTTPGTANGGNITTRAVDDGTAEEDEFEADGKVYTANEAIELISWGQRAYTLKAYDNGRIITGSSGNPIANTNTGSYEMSSAGASSLTTRIRKDINDDDTVTFAVDSYSESFGGGFETRYYTNGRYIQNDNGTVRVNSSTIGNKTNEANKTDSQKFKEITLKEAGADAQVWQADNDYAIVVVGNAHSNSTGEGADRADLNLGQEQYELIENVAEAFPGNTIVIIKSNYPVAAQEIEDNDNVGAVLFQPYAGQYDNKALAEVLFGDYAPTGRLSSTWYEDTSALPAIDESSLPQGESYTLDSIDSKFTVDMTNGDPLDTSLTYMYTDANVTYPFGYGLGYSEFSYDNIQVPAQASGDDTIDVTVDVTNNGTVTTSEIVQLYVKNNSTAYGEYTPKLQLAAYNKVEIPAGETATVTISIDPADFQIWDVNRNEYITESGNYTVMVGSSSDDIAATGSMNYTGIDLGTRIAGRESFNVFDASFATNNVYYREVSKNRTAEGMKNNASEYGYYAVVSKDDEAWVAIPNVSLGDITKITAEVSTDAAGGVIDLCLDSPDGFPFASIDVPVMGAVTRPVPSTSGTSIRDTVELDYATVETTPIVADTQGVHDLYIKFNAEDLRIDSLEFEIEGFVDVDTTALDALIAEAEGYEESNYTSDSWAGFAEVLAKAQRIAASFGSTQLEIDMMIEALQTAIDSLVGTYEEDPNKYVLNYYIKWAYGLIEDGSVDKMIRQAKEEFETALAAAEAVAKKAGATEDEIKEAVFDLVWSIAKSEWIKGNVDALDALVDICEAVDLSEYEDGAVKTRFINALNAAKELLDDKDNYFQTEIDAVYQELFEALEALSKLNWIPLISAIALAETIMPMLDLYVDNGKTQFQNAYNAAKALVEDGALTQNQINDAADALLEAIGNMKLKANKSLLQSALGRAEEIEDLSIYTASSADNFVMMRAMAVEVFLDESLSTDDQQTVDTTTNNLVKAINNLKLKPTKDDLEKLVKEAKGIDKNVYKEDSVKALEDALKQAEDVLNNPDATEEDIEKAYEKLEEAISNLVPVDGTNPTDDPNQSEDPNQSQGPKDSDGNDGTDGDNGSGKGGNGGSSTDRKTSDGKTNSKTSVKTGDTNIMNLLIVIMLLSVSVLGGVLIYKKRRG